MVLSFNKKNPGHLQFHKVLMTIGWDVTKFVRSHTWEAMKKDKGKISTVLYDIQKKQWGQMTGEVHWQKALAA
jgi:hypothetical protein